MPEKNKTLTAKNVSLGGILLALTVITLYLESILPTSKLALYMLSSFFVSVIVMELSVKTGWVFYAASVLLSLVVVQNKLELIPYIAFFGNYGLIKFYIEKINRHILEYVLKLIYFNLWFGAALLFLTTFIFDNLNIKLPVWLIIIVFQAAFLIYDYVYTLFIRYYSGKLKPMLKI